MIFDQKCKKMVFISSGKKASRLTSKFLSESRRLFTVVGGKVKNETDATFSDVYDVFASKFCYFSHLSTKSKVNHAFKAKKGNVSGKKSAKSEK